jgi:hypothetical protein
MWSHGAAYRVLAATNGLVDVVVLHAGRRSSSDRRSTPSRGPPAALHRPHGVRERSGAGVRLVRDAVVQWVVGIRAAPPCAGPHTGVCCKALLCGL